MSTIGEDISSEWTFNENGDLKLVSGNANINQAISNRLNTGLHSLDLFYGEYGSFLTSFLGWKANQRTLDFMKIEIENRLLQDPRLRDFNVSCAYNGNGEIEININAIIGNEEYDTNLVLNSDGVDVVGN